MAGYEWTVKVNADVKELLTAARQIGQEGQKAGDAFESGFAGGSNTINGLRSRLQELNKTLDTVAIGSREFQAAQKGIAATQKEIDVALTGGNSILKNIKQEVTSFALQAGAVLSIGEAFRFAGQQIVELDQAGAAVRTLGIDSNKLGDSLGALSKELNSNVSKVQLMKAAYDVASSGFSSVSDITDILRASTLGATGGFAELADVSKATISVLNAYGLSAKDAGRIVDQFVQVQNDGTITVRQYANEIGNVAAVAAAAGIPIEELNAAVAAVTNKGVPVEQTFTGIRQAIASILKPTKEATDLAASLGIEFNLSGLKAKGFGGLMAEIQAKTGGAADKLAILLGSVEAQAAIQPLLNDLLVKYNQALENQTKAAGSAAKASLEASDTISGGMTKLKNAASDFAATMATAGSPVAGILDALSKLIQAAGVANSAINNIFAALSPQNLGQQAAVLLGKLFGYEVDITAEKKKQDDFVGSINNSILKLLGINSQNTEQQKEQNKENKIGNDQAAKKITILDDQLSVQIQQVQAAQKLSEAQADYNKASGDNQIRGLEAQLNLSKALADVIDSRFGIERSMGTYLMNQARERGASEADLANMKRKNDRIEQAALQAKYTALLQGQAIERQIFDLKQRMALMDADQAVNEARSKYQIADLKYRQNANYETEKERDIARSNLAIAEERASTLRQIQPLEKQVSGYTQEQARNLLKGQAAAQGLKIEADGTLTKVKQTADTFRTYGNTLQAPLGQQRQMADYARRIGLDVRGTGAGYYEIGRALSGEKVVDKNASIASSMRIAATQTKKAADQARGLRSETEGAAYAAADFYQQLQLASGLPAVRARFAGGPVTAGETYRINDGPGGRSLGQEAFLSSSGILSLINRPMNSLWQPPSSGYVIPAAITEQLKRQGQISGSGASAAVLRSGDPAMAGLAMAVGNLSQEVAELRRKAWNVEVGVGDNGRGLELLRMRQRMR